MFGFRVLGPGKVFGLTLVLVLIIALVLSRNSNYVMHILVNAEVSLKTADFEQYKTEHFMIKYLPQDEKYIAYIADSAEEAYEILTKKFQREPQKLTTVVVYPDTISLAKSFGWDKDEKAMGVYWAGTIRILSPRAWLQDHELDRFAREGPMVHEFAHLMVDELTRGNYNRWWTEGVAQYLEKNITGFQFDNPFFDGKEFKYYEILKLDKHFDDLDQPIAYWQSLALVEYIVDQYGEEKLFAILSYLEKGYGITQAFELSLDIEYQLFEQQFYSELDKQGERCINWKTS